MIAECNWSKRNHGITPALDSGFFGYHEDQYNFHPELPAVVYTDDSHRQEKALSKILQIAQKVRIFLSHDNIETLFSQI